MSYEKGNGIMKHSSVLVEIGTGYYGQSQDQKVKTDKNQNRGNDYPVVVKDFSELLVQVTSGPYHHKLR